MKSESYPDGIEALREWLRAGTSIIFPTVAEVESEDTRRGRTIEASFLEDIVEQSSQRIDVPIHIENAIIAGPLNLAHVSFNRSVDLVGSDFLDDVNLSCTTFSRAANFTRSKFRCKLNLKGSEIQHDLVIAAVKIQGVLTADDLKVGVSFDAQGAEFNAVSLDRFMVKGKAQFNTSKIDGAIFSTRFGGPASFREGKIGGFLDFTGSVFAGGASFEGMEIADSVYFNTYVDGDFYRQTEFLGDARFVRLRVGGYAEFDGAIFRGPATFNRAKFGTGLFLRPINDEVKFLPAQFDSDVKILNASIIGNFEAPCAVFRQTATFSGTHFHGRCAFNGAQFLGVGDFNGAEFERASVFGPFKTRDKLASVIFNGKANFRGAYFKSSAEFTGVLFKKEVSFEYVQIEGYAFFQSYNADDQYLPTCFSKSAKFAFARFSSPVFFTGARFEDYAQFDSITCEQHINFGTARTKEGLRPAIFLKDVDFRNARVNSNGSFEGAQFGGNVSFNTAHFGRGVHFRPAFDKDAFLTVCVAGNTNCVSMYVGSTAEFDSAQFRGTVEFQLSRIEGSLYFRPSRHLSVKVPVRFHEKANFSSSHVSGPVEFTGAQFIGDATFDQCSFGSSVRFGPIVDSDELIPVTFEGRASFVRLNAAGTTNFISAKFKKTADFTQARFETNAYFRANRQGTDPILFASNSLFPSTVFKAIGDFRGARFEGNSDFRNSQSIGVMLLQGTTFARSLSLREANFSIVLLREETDAVPWGAATDEGGLVKTERTEAQFLAKVDLRGFSYHRLIGDWRTLFRSIAPYDRESYSHFETILRKSGHDDEADRVYLDLRRVEEKNYWNRVWRKNEYTNGPLRQSLIVLPRAMAESFQRIVFNYGVRPYRLLAFSLLFLLIGVAVFSQPNAVSQKDKSSAPQTTGSTVLSKTEAFNVSLNQFIPVVELHPGSQWVPSDYPAPILGAINLSFAGYATLHRLAGAILVPLGIAALTGILRRTEPR